MIGPEWLYHPLGVCPLVPHAQRIACQSYNFWSGVAGSFLISLPSWLVALGLFFRHRNCHHKRCWSIHTHNHPEHGWPACKQHWREIPEHLHRPARSGGDTLGQTTTGGDW